MEIILRDYQLKALAHYQEEVSRDSKGALFSIATGKGKSILSLEIIKIFLKSNLGNILVLSPTVLIRNQLYNLYSRFLPTILLDGLKLRKKFFEGRVFLACYPTYEKIIRDEEALGLSFSMVLIDEVHKVPIEGVLGTMLKKVSKIKESRGEPFFKVGFTATLGSPTKRKNIETLLEILPGRTYEDVTPLYQKEEVIISLDPTPWRYNLIRNLRKDLGSWFTTKLRLPLAATEPPVLSLNKRYPIHIQATYLLVNKLVRLTHGGTPNRIREYYFENILKSRLSITKYLSPTTVELLSEVRLPPDQRIEPLLKLPPSRKIIFIEDRKIGLELTTPEDYFIHSKEKNKVREVLKTLSKKKLFNLYSTSIAEEGLNLLLDQVVNFEVPTTRVKVEQRQGRIGRYKAGRVLYFNIRKTYGSSLLYRYGKIK